MKQELLNTPVSENWYASLRNMMSHFFVVEQRTSVRERVLEIVGQMFEDHHYYGNLIAENAVLTFLPTVYLDESGV